MQTGLLLGGLIGGLLLSQGITFLRQINTLLENSELRKEQRIQDLTQELRDAFELEKVKHEKFLEEVCRRPLEKKAEVLDQKLSLVLSKLTSSSGSYKTTIGIEEMGLKQTRDMNEIVKKAGGQLSENYTKILEKYAIRDDSSSAYAIRDDSKAYTSRDGTFKSIDLNLPSNIVWSEVPHFSQRELVKEILETPDMDLEEKSL